MISRQPWFNECFIVNFPLLDIPEIYLHLQQEPTLMLKYLIKMDFIAKIETATGFAIFAP